MTGARAGEALQAVARAVASADRLSVGDTELWWCALPRLADEHLDDAVERGWLTAHERRDADRKPDARLRSRYAARRIIRRLVAASHLGVTATDVSVTARCVQCGEVGHGPPEVVGHVSRLYMSTASVGDRVAIALGRRSIGVDLESPRRLADVPSERLPTLIPGWDRVQAACPAGATVTHVWTAMEALVKTTGHGLHGTCRQLDHAISSHELVWFTGPTGLVTCLARPTG